MSFVKVSPEVLSRPRDAADIATVTVVMGMADKSANFNPCYATAVVRVDHLLRYYDANIPFADLADFAASQGVPFGSGLACTVVDILDGTLDFAEFAENFKRYHADCRRRYMATV